MVDGVPELTLFSSSVALGERGSLVMNAQVRHFRVFAMREQLLLLNYGHR